MKHENHVVLLICLLFSTNCHQAKLTDTSELKYPKHKLSHDGGKIQPQQINAFLTDEISLKNKSKPKNLLFPCEDQTHFAYKNVSFTCNAKLGLKAEAEELTEVPLDYETDTGDGVHPDYLSFKLRDGIAYKKKEHGYRSVIEVYPIEDYRRMFSISDKRVEQFDGEMKLLQKLIAEQPAEINYQAPSIASVNAVQAFRAHIKYPSFKNGKGIAFLTQHITDYENINNRALIYVFQGITDDNKYYIYALIPVSTKILPDYVNSAVDEYKDIEQKYKQYISETTKQLENLQPNQFKPDLDEALKLFSSIEVK